MHELEGFIDDSKIKGRTRTKIQGGRSEQEYVLPMRIYPTVFQSKIAAFMKYVRENL